MGFWQRLKEWGNTVPDCPTCEGTGVAKGIANHWQFWKGEKVLVCWQCGGRGKV